MQVAFRNCAPFTKCVTKIDGTTKDDAENLVLVMPMYNQIEYSSNYSETAGSLWLTLQTLIILNLSSIRLSYYKTQLLSLHQMQQMELEEMQQFLCH